MQLLDHNGSSQEIEIEKLLNNNDQPSDAAAQEVRRIRAKPLKELEDLDAEIQLLERHLQELKIKRIEVRERAERYDHILSPIRQVSSDILHHIFYHCLPAHRDPIMSATEAPVLLTRICRAWRDIAFTSPRLWTRIYITFSDEELLPDAETSLGSSELVTQKLRLRCNAIEEWFSHSGACPLSISICYTSFIWSPTLDLFPGASDTTLQLFRTLAHFSDRWQKLELRVPLEVYLKLESMLTVSQLPNLTSLRATLYNQLSYKDGVEVAILKAPYLKTISMSAHTALWNIAQNSPNWSDLTNISCLGHSSLSVTDTIILLRNCRNLEYFEVNMSTGFTHDHIPSPPALGREPIPLPRLRAICIFDNVDPNFLGNFYELIYAPQLKWVEYLKGDEYVNDWFRDTSSPPPISSLLEKSTALKKLNIEADHFTTEQMRRIFQSVNQITHLVLGKETRTNQGSLAPPSFPLFVRTTWDFDRLFVKEGERPSENDSNSTPSLLPHLEVLEFSASPLSHTSDDALLEFILGRMIPVSPPKIAVLKQISGFFNRSKEKDISEVVGRRAEEIGTKFKLELNYIEQPAGRPIQAQQTIDPRYGLNVLVDRSWQYNDLEELEMFMGYQSSIVEANAL